MVTMIVTCAGCGRRSKGTPSPTKKYRCAHCTNTLTFPRTPQSPPLGKALCSNCWNATDARSEPTVCPVCGQRIASRDGGRAAFPGLFTKSAEPKPLTETDEKLARTMRDLKAKIVAAQIAAVRQRSTNTSPAPEKPVPAENDPDVEEVTDADDVPAPAHDGAAKAADVLPAAGQSAVTASVEMLGVRDEALKARNDALARVAQLEEEKARAQRELDALRETVLRTLEPVAQEYAHRMQEKIAEADAVRTLLQQVRANVNAQLDALDGAVYDLRTNLETVSHEMNAQLVKTIGADKPDGEVVAAPAFAADGPFAELLAAGLPPGAAVIVSRYTPVDGNRSAPAA
ncbi:MAG: hypothetical protein NTW87_06505 [Planctomycetota bacterium]|nr:hypothetical protein [Planctomycetota bacterium]